MQLVAGLELQVGQQGQLVAHPAHGGEEHAVPRVDADGVVDLTDASSAQRAVGQDQLAVLLDELQGGGGGGVGTEQVPYGLHRRDLPRHSDAVALLHAGAALQVHGLAGARDRLDGGVGEHLVDLEGAEAGGAATGRDDVEARDHGLHGVELTGLEGSPAAGQAGREAQRLLADVPPLEGR